MRPAAMSLVADRVLAALALLPAVAFAAWLVSTATIDPSTIGFLLFAVLWVSAPYVALAVAALVLSTNWISRAVLALAIVASVRFGFWAFGFIDDDPQGGLLVLFVPLYQNGGVLLAIGIVVLVELVKRSRSAPPDEE